MSIRLDLPRLATAIALIGILAMAVRVPASPDMWWHLRCGEVQWRTGRVLRAETFSHTAPGAPWVNQSWLPQLMMYALHAWGGFAALALAVGLLVALTYGLLWLAAPLGEAAGAWWAPYWRAGVLLWAAIAGGPAWAARPHLLTLLFTALWLALLERWRAHGRRARDLFWLPPLMLLWANSHGGYVLGLLLLAIEVGGLALERAAWPHVRTLLLVLLLCLLAATINPQGIRLLLFPFRTLGSLQQSAIAEWASPDWHAPELWPALGLLLATWAALALAPARPAGRPGSTADLLRALYFTAMALRSARYIGLAALVLAPLLIRHGADVIARARSACIQQSSAAPHAAQGERSPSRGWPALNWALLILVLLGAGIKVAQPLDPGTIARVHQARFPVQAAERLFAGDLPPELFNEYGWGGYLIWAGADERGKRPVRVFIDGRADPYGDELIAAYRLILSVRPGWEETLERYGVRTALLAAGSGLGSVLRESGRWREVYADEVAEIWVREAVRESRGCPHRCPARSGRAGA